MSERPQNDPPPTGRELDGRQQAIVSIAAFTAQGDLDRLAEALNAGLDAGLTVSEVKEVLVHLYAYLGFPRSLNGLTTLMAVLEERRARGRHDPPGREASPLPAGKSSLELGAEIQARLVGGPVTGPVYAFAPVIDHLLKAHLFGDLFGRDVLDFRQRELATVSALASLGNVNPQLAGHCRAALNVGLSAGQLRALVAVLAERLGPDLAGNAGRALEGVLGA